MLIRIGKFHRADFGAVVAVDAAGHIHVAWLLPQGNRKITGLALDINHMGVGQDVDIGVLVVLEISGRYGWTRAAITVVRGTPAKDAVMLWEHVAQLRHPAPQAGRLLDEICFQARIRNIKRGAHPPKSPANNER